MRNSTRTAKQAAKQFKDVLNNNDPLLNLMAIRDFDTPRNFTGAAD
jgi:hypothetical protein